MDRLVAVLFVLTVYLIAIHLVTATRMRPIRSVLAPAGAVRRYVFKNCIAIYSHVNTSLVVLDPRIRETTYIR